ncbi:hypothetical protein VPH35_001312 [Triticum aestivum]
MDVGAGDVGTPLLPNGLRRPGLIAEKPNHGQFVPTPIVLRQSGILVTKENGSRSIVESLKPDVPTMTYTTLEKQNQYIICACKIEDRTYIYFAPGSYSSALLHAVPFIIHFIIHISIWLLYIDPITGM